MNSNLTIELAEANMRVARALDELRAAERAAQEIEDKIKPATQTRAEELQAERDAIRATEAFFDQKVDKINRIDALEEAEKVTDKVLENFDKAAMLETPLAKFSETNTFSRPTPSYLRPATRAELAKMKTVELIDYKLQLRDFLTA